jgi:predicted transcriptional regulator
MIRKFNVDNVCEAIDLLQNNGFEVRNVEFNEGTSFQLCVEKKPDPEPKEKRD